jgi:hypothetical protein
MSNNAKVKRRKAAKLTIVDYAEFILEIAVAECECEIQPLGKQCWPCRAGAFFYPVNPVNPVKKKKGSGTATL